MRILIVDDEAGVLQALMAVVRAIPGHDVRVAAGAQKAHEHAAALGGVDLLVTDVVMEPTDGFTLRAELQGLHPSMQTVFVSGYDLSEYSEQIAGAPVLAKPVDADALRTEIENAAARLAAPPAPVAVAQAVVAQPVAVAVAKESPQNVPSVPTVVQPSAVPRAVPAQPVAVPQPAVRAVPQGMPAPAAAQPAARAVPQATPAAAPVPVAAAVAQPTVHAVPQAAPVATPSAGPRAVAAPAAPPAQPTVRAVPQATPVAAPVPVATPAAQPTVRAVPQATPVATPVATPSAGPRAVAAPTAPPAQPTVRAVPQATPPAAPRAAAPVASAVAAVPQAAAVVPPPAAPPVGAPGAQPDPLIGVQLGDYRVQQFIGDGKWGRVYLALQLSVNRRVGLKVLNPERSEDEGVRAQFLADARAKAAVQHPFIMSVFEADERNGLAFYTHEFLDGASMEERIARGQKFDEKTALHVMKVAGEGLQYLWSHNLSHAPIEAGSLRLGADNIARMANIAVADADPSVTVEKELLTVGTLIQQLTQEQLISGGLRALLARMTGGPNPVTGWPVVLQAVKALEPKVIPVEAAKMKAADAAALRAVEAARKAKQRGRYIYLGVLSLVLIVLAFAVWKIVLPKTRRLDLQVEVPAGSYTVGNTSAGTKASLGAFDIDKYEVSIGEYAKFIAWCEKNPENEHKYDHPRGDRKMSHVNDEAKTLILNAARGGRVFKQDGNPARNIPSDPGVEIDLNSPMVGVTFWDAYAYAHWRGEVLENGAARDVPTEEEWEAAARGPRGLNYPWGDELKVKNFNSNQGYKSLSPGGAKTDDGYNYWAPVDAFGNDQSEFKVVGMAGNVCEWVYRKEGNKEIPLLKGGSFASEPIPMWERILKIPADDAWFVWPAANKPKGNIPAPPGVSRYFVGDDVTAGFRSLYVGFRTVKRK